MSLAQASCSSARFLALWPRQAYACTLFIGMAGIRARLASSGGSGSGVAVAAGFLA
jgi:hypothetical protein